MNRFQEIEFYNTPDCEVMIKPKGDLARVLAETGKENRVSIPAFISHLVTFYTKVWEASSLLYSRKEPDRLNYEHWIASRFIRRNFGGYDANSLDMDVWGRFHFEEVKYSIRNERPFAGIVCKPEFNTTLPSRETSVFRLVIERYKVDDIAQLLRISPHTVVNHIRNIHEKTSTRTIADLIDYRYTHNLKQVNTMVTLEEQKGYIRTNYKKLTGQFIAKMLGIRPEKVYALVKKLGLKK